MEDMGIPFTDSERDTLVVLLAEFALASGNPIREGLLKMRIKMHGKAVEARVIDDMVRFREEQAEILGQQGLLN